MPCLRRASLLSDRYSLGPVELTRGTHNSVSSFGFTAIIVVQLAAVQDRSRGHHPQRGMNEIYNPNPTVLKTAGKRGTRTLSNLWDLDEVQTETGGYGLYNDSSVSETIDQNEIFGQLLSFSILAC